MGGGGCDGSGDRGATGAVMLRDLGEAPQEAPHPFQGSTLDVTLSFTFWLVTPAGLAWPAAFQVLPARPPLQDDRLVEQVLDL